MTSLCGLRRAAALCGLAKQIHWHEALVHDLEGPPWADLTFDEKHVYVLKAQIAIDLPAAVTRPPLGGAVTPSGPADGVAQPVNWFDQACIEAREAGRRVVAFRGPVEPDSRD